MRTIVCGKWFAENSFIVLLSILSFDKEIPNKYDKQKNPRISTREQLSPRIIFSANNFSEYQKLETLDLSLNKLVLHYKPVKSSTSYWKKKDQIHVRDCAEFKDLYVKLKVGYKNH